MAYIETPRTEGGNATFMTNGHNLEDFSVENSLLPPTNKKENIISLMRNGHSNHLLKTPRVGARFPLADRRNVPVMPKQAEFTPLLQSVHKKNIDRGGKRKSGPETPAHLRNGYVDDKSPALPSVDQSAMYSSDFGSSVMRGDNGSTPIPQVVSSSAQSTPLAVLPKRDATGVLNEQGNLMTLREQEHIIDKIEKENFGLKLKITFLEKTLRNAGPGLNEAALKENMDLKVDKVQLHRDLTRLKKTLNSAERDVGLYRRQIEEAQSNARKSHADESLRKELEDLKAALLNKQEEVDELNEKFDAAEDQNADLRKLKEDIDDLEADVREKDRQIELREEEIDRVKAEAKRDADELEEVLADLDTERKQNEKMEGDQEAVKNSEKKLEEAREELEDALAAQRKAENDLDELQEEMANKSLNTKGLSRQLEEKANRLQTEVHDLKRDHSQLQSSSEDKARRIIKLEEALQNHEQDADVQHQKLQDRHDLLKHEHEATVRRCESLNTQLQQTIRDLQNKSEEKDLLHTRHDALTTESQGLQKDVNKARAHILELETNLQDEREHAEDNDRQLQSDAKAQHDQLSAKISALQRQLDDQHDRIAAERDQWKSQQRDLESQKARVDEQLAGLQRTIDKLHESEGTLSGKEMKLQEALESEKQRHQSEETMLESRIQELKDDVEEKRQEIEEIRSEWSQAKENLRVSEREREDLETENGKLDDEIVMLQDQLEDDAATKVVEKLESAEEEANDLRAQLIEVQQKLDELDSPEAKKTSPEVEQLQDEIKDLSQQLQDTKVERQCLQDKLATNSLDLHKHKSLLSEAEAERDELRSQLDEMRNQVDDTFKFDQERIDLRTSKIRLEGEVERLRAERKASVERQTALEEELEGEVARASAEENRLNAEIEDLKSNLSTKTGGQNRERRSIDQKAQRLQCRVEELEILLASSEQPADGAREISLLQKDVTAARQKESEFLQREKVQKEVLRDLKVKVSQLEKQSHDAEMARLAVDSPKSSAAGSARKNEVAELHRQVTELNQQLRDTKSKFKDEQRTLQRRLADTEREAHASSDALTQQQEQLEADLAASCQEQESLQTKNASATQTITRLRTRISTLEHDLSLARRGQTAADTTIAEERADLHDMLKEAQLTAEDLQLQIEARDASLRAATSKEKDLRTQLRRVREERSTSAQKATALTAELDTLHGKYDRVISKFSAEQKKWHDERRAIVSKVRFTNVDTSSLHGGDRGGGEMEAKHKSELRTLGLQIQYLRSRNRRSEAFREALGHEKAYLALQVKMFEACNRADLKLLGEMGVTPAASVAKTRSSAREGRPFDISNSVGDGDIHSRLHLTDAIRAHIIKTQSQGSGRGRPSLRGVVGMVMAVGRMKRAAEAWRKERRVGEEVKRMVRAQRMSLDSAGLDRGKVEKRRRSGGYR